MGTPTLTPLFPPHIELRYEACEGALGSGELEVGVLENLSFDFEPRGGGVQPDGPKTRIYYYRTYSAKD